MRKKHIPIFTTADDDHILELIVLISSIADKSSDDNIYDIRIMHEGLSKHNIRRLRHLKFKNVELLVTDVTDLIATYTSAVSTLMRPLAPMTEFYRFFIPCMYPRIQQAIYVDNDVVLCDDIAQLLNVDMKDSIICAPHSAVSDTEEMAEYVRSFLGINPEEYLDAGILILNMNAYREHGVLTKLIEFLTERKPESLATADDALSYICRGRITWLDAVWGAQSYEERADMHPSLIHYNYYKKPIYYLDSPYSEAFWTVASRTAFFEDIMLKCMAHDDEARRRDLELRDRIIDRARALSVRRGTAVKKREALAI